MRDNFVKIITLARLPRAAQKDIAALAMTTGAGR